MATTSLWHIEGRLKDLIAYVENPEKQGRIILTYSRCGIYFPMSAAPKRPNRANMFRLSTASKRLPCSR